MARYEYWCPNCELTVHRVVHQFKDADEQLCDNEDRFGEEEEGDESEIPESEVCGAKLERVLFPKERRALPALQTDGAWKMGAVMGDGKVVQGHFGKDAARKKK